MFVGAICYVACYNHYVILSLLTDSCLSKFMFTNTEHKVTKQQKQNIMGSRIYVIMCFCHIAACYCHPSIFLETLNLHFSS